MTRAKGEPLPTHNPDGSEAVLAPAGGGTVGSGVGARVRRLWATLATPAGLVAAMILLVCVPFQIGVGGTLFGLGDVLSGVLVVVVVVRALRDGLRLTRPNAVLFGSVVLATSIVAIAGTDTTASVAGWIRYLQLFALVPVAIVLAMRNRRDVELVAHALILAALVQGVVSVIQVVTGNGASFGGQDVRAVGTFGATDVIAASVILGLGITVCVGLTLSATGRRRAVYIVTAVGLLGPLGLTLSRGSWIATVVAVVVVLMFAGWRVFLSTMVVGAAAVTVLVGGLGLGSALIGDRIDSIGQTDSSVNDRYDLWGTAVDMWIDHPITGVGLKAFPRFRDSYAPLSLNSGSDVGGAGLSFQRQELLSPHNQYLLVLSEQGAVGILPFIALLLVTAGSTVAAAVRGPREARGLGAGLVGLSVWQLDQFIYGDLGGATSLVTSVIIGLTAWYGLEQGVASAAGTGETGGDAAGAVAGQAAAARTGS